MSNYEQKSMKPYYKRKTQNRSLTDEQICMIWELKDQGLNQREIQEKVQTTRYYVRKTLKGPRPIPPQRNPPEPEYDEEDYEDEDLDDQFENLAISQKVPRPQQTNEKTEKPVYDFAQDDNIDGDIDWIDDTIESTALYEDEDEYESETPIVEELDDEEFSESESEEEEVVPRTYLY